MSDEARSSKDARSSDGGVANEDPIPDTDSVNVAGFAADLPRDRTRRAQEAPLELLSKRGRRARPERKVPLTRLPLRPQAEAVAWPGMLEAGSACNREARHRLLAEFARAGERSEEAVLIAAYREEDAHGRALALRGLMRSGSSDAREIFEEALRDGTDEERAAAVEALAVGGLRESLTTALTDRVDAIAARAALGYVSSRRRADYHLALSPFVDAARIDALLSLLAGYLE